MKTTCNVRIKISGEVFPEMIKKKFLNTYRNGGQLLEKSSKGE